MVELRSYCRYSGVYVKSFERDRWFLECGRAPNHLKSASADAVIDLTRLIQELYKSFQIMLLQTLDVFSQALVTEKSEEKSLVVGVGGVEPLEPLLNIRN